MRPRGRKWDELTEKLRRRGITILYEDRHPFAGGSDYYAVFFEDPDRIKVEVVGKKQKGGNSGCRWKTVKENPLYQIYYTKSFEREQALGLNCAYCRALKSFPPSERNSLVQEIVEFRGSDIRWEVELDYFRLATRHAAYLWDDLCWDIFTLLTYRKLLGKRKTLPRLTKKKFDDIVTQIDKDYRQTQEKSESEQITICNRYN